MKEDVKFRELILLVARASESDDRCEATKLNKLLFYSDFRAYDKLGQSISGESYQKLERGPAPTRIAPVLAGMEAEGLCAWEVRESSGQSLKKLVSRRDPDLSMFSPEEIQLTRTVIQELWDLDAGEVSALSHRFAGWQVAELGEEIPYGMVFVDEPRPLTPEEIAWAHEAIQAYLAETTA